MTFVAFVAIVSVVVLELEKAALLDGATALAEEQSSANLTLLALAGRSSPESRRAGGTTVVGMEIWTILRLWERTNKSIIPLNDQSVGDSAWKGGQLTS